jgi:hypothetical protein
VGRALGSLIGRQSLIFAFRATWPFWRSCRRSRPSAFAAVRASWPCGKYRRGVHTFNPTESPGPFGVKLDKEPEPAWGDMRREHPTQKANAGRCAAFQVKAIRGRQKVIKDWGRMGAPAWSTTQQAIAGRSSGIRRWQARARHRGYRNGG